MEKKIHYFLIVRNPFTKEGLYFNFKEGDDLINFIWDTQEDSPELEMKLHITNFYPSWAR